MTAHRSFVPAAGHDLLLPLYDPIQKLLGGDAARDRLLASAGLQPGQRALDVGCGTGRLLADLARAHPGVEAVGLDPDPKALARARRRLVRAGARCELDEGFADALPYPDARFDHVFSSFMFHHLDEGTKTRMLAEARRVLAPGGRLHLLDFGAAEGGGGWLARLLHASAHLHGQDGARILAGMRDAGFAEAREVGERRSLIGRVGFFEARVAS